MDDARRAYAVLGLPQGSSLREVRRRYLLLAKRWHPDRFASDPAAETTAADRMRSFNGAYRTLVERLGRPTPSQTPSPPIQGRRLTREEVDRLVASIGSEGPLDSFLTSIGWVSSSLNAAFGVVSATALLLRVAYMVLTVPFAQLFSDPLYAPDAVFLIILLLVVAHEAYQRLELRAHARSINESPSNNAPKLTDASRRRPE